jgi:hypothetical protein
MGFYLPERIAPRVYPTPIDERAARLRRRLGYLAWFITFAGLGVLLAWRM